MYDVYLKTKDLEKLNRSYIGQGSDAKVYKISKDILYKIYHTTSKNNNRVVRKLNWALSKL